MTGTMTSTISTDTINLVSALEMIQKLTAENKLLKEQLNKTPEPEPEPESEPEPQPEPKPACIGQMWEYPLTLVAVRPHAFKSTKVYDDQAETWRKVDDFKYKAKEYGFKGVAYRTDIGYTSAYIDFFWDNIGKERQVLNKCGKMIPQLPPMLEHDYYGMKARTEKWGKSL